MHQLRIKRIYATAEKDDGYRILTDRLWPRGVPKSKAAIDQWAKEIAPTVSLRQWFGHKRENFPTFTDRYIAELDANPDAPAFAEQCFELMKRDNVTLLYGAKDEQCNHAVVLRNWILKQVDE